MTATTTNETPRAHVSTLAHVAIRATSLPATIAFYTRVLGLRQVPRPPFNFEGAWLGNEQGEALIHLYGGQRAQGPDGRVPVGSAAIDHVSLWAHGFQDQHARLQSLGLAFRVSRVPESTLAQIFVYDPNSVMIELTYDLRNETGAKVEVGGNLSGFEPAQYAQFDG
jgi:catechol 2,3-dioxygenase-like lactoylglutathione lyase family enzyme